MKITKRQLKRIIREEKARLIKEQPGGDYSTGRWDGLEGRLEEVLYEMQTMFIAVNGVDRMEANEMVMDECARILGANR